MDGANERTGLAHLGDFTREGAHPPKVVQFRIELRAASEWLAARLSEILAPRAGTLLAMPIRACLRLWDTMLFSTAIQLGMTLLMMQDFHHVSLVGPLTSIPPVILTGLIVPLGFLTLACTLVGTRLAMAIAKVVSLSAGLLLATVQWFGRLARVSYRVPGPSAWLMVIFFAALICLAATPRAAVARHENRIANSQMPPQIHPTEWIAAAALAILTLVAASYPFAPNIEPRRLEVSVLDVGQGDSIFAAFPDGRTMLIDGGGPAGSEWTGRYRTGIDIGEEVVSPCLWSHGLKRLDVVALRHAHHDHLDSLLSVLQNFCVR
jgi:competence protein ComEC